MFWDHNQIITTIDIDIFHSTSRAVWSREIVSAIGQTANCQKCLLIYDHHNWHTRVNVTWKLFYQQIVQHTTYVNFTSSCMVIHEWSWMKGIYIKRVWLTCYESDKTGRNLHFTISRWDLDSDSIFSVYLYSGLGFNIR